MQTRFALTILIDQSLFKSHSRDKKVGIYVLFS